MLNTAVYGMSSQVQWWFLLHCADKMAHICGSRSSRWVNKHVCRQKQKSRLLCFFKPVCLGFCFVVQVLQFWGRKVCLFRVFVCMCVVLLLLRKLFVVFECCWSRASFFVCSQHVNHIAYWAECKTPPKKKKKLHRPKPQISVVYRTSKSVSVRPPVCSETVKPRLSLYLCYRSFLRITKAWNGDGWHIRQEKPPPTGHCTQQ